MTDKNQFFLRLALTLAALAAAAALWALPAAALPPRPTSPAPPAGGLISLTAVPGAPVIPDKLWTRVQWQDPQGGWHDVDGWRGAFAPNLTVTWWVAPADLNTGPFRWLVYPDKGSDTAIAMSEPFYLPPAGGQTTAVTVTLP